MDLGAGREVRAFAAIARAAHVAEPHAAHRAGFVVQGFARGEAGEDVDAGGFGLGAQPRHQLRDRDDEVAVIALLRRRRQAVAAARGQETELVALHRHAGRRRRGAPVGHQRIERHRVEHRAGQRMRAEARRLLDHAHGAVGIELAQPQRAGESGRTGADDRHVVFHHVPFAVACAHASLPAASISPVAARMAARAASRKAAAPSGSCGCGRRMPSAVTRDAARTRQDLAGREAVARAEDGQRHDRCARAFRGGKCAGVEAQQARLAQERAFGKEGQRIAARGAAHHAQCVARSARAVAARDELHADPPQQESGQRHRRHFALDDEVEARRQHRCQHHAIEVAAVIGDHDAGIGESGLPAHAHRHAHQRQRGAAHPLDQAPASGQRRDQRQRQERQQGQGQEDGRGVDAINQL